MDNKQAAVMDCIAKAVASLNEERGPDEQIVLDEHTSFFGEGSVLDSLSLVSVIVDLETLVSDQFGKSVSLTDDRAMSRNPVPFVDVKTLRSYLLELLAE